MKLSDYKKRTFEQNITSAKPKESFNSKMNLKKNQKRDQVH